ncbi:helix-turn-helix transcriptional regulator [Mitsuokella jalaludinii]|mgnify:FL=1|uniref:helix-turn-helix transcriptional regulator n=1 Tax=Mitsuokella jalaludinii TaxID=187979 RepID=UPI0026765B51|nr:helix-turn-helix transcriptional regulator [uncultured Mitsuokella sp.]
MEKLNLGWLKRARYNKHLTVEQVAASIGKTRSAIWRYESGITDITVGTLCQLLQLYGVSVTDVFCQIREGDGHA